MTVALPAGRSDRSVTLTAVAADMVDMIFEEEDLPYEEEILRNPFSVKCWLRYIDHKKAAPKDRINLIYERSLRELPGSYKLWYETTKISLL